MRRVIATTAAALMMSTAMVYAAGQTDRLETYQAEQQGDIYASNFIGMRVYADEQNWDSMDQDFRATEGMEQEWDDIGEVGDIILGSDGTVKAVVLDVGGFLGMGEKNVAVSMKEIKIVQEEGESDDFFLVVKANKEMLTDLEAFEKGEKRADISADQKTEDTAAVDDQSEETAALGDKEPTEDAASMNDQEQTDETAASDGQDAEDKTAALSEGEEVAKPSDDAQMTEQNADQSEEQDMAARDATNEEQDAAAMDDENREGVSEEQTAAVPDRELLPRPDVTREGYLEAEPAELTSEVLVGARVYGNNDDDIGEVNKLVLSEDGEITEVVIDVGGFLGMGEHSVAVSFEELQILRTEDGQDFRVYINADKTALESLPAYTKG